MGNSMRFLPKLKLELSYDQTILLLGIYLKKIKSLSRGSTYTPMYTVAWFITAKTWKQPKCSLTGEWKKNVCAYVCTHTHKINTHTKILFSHIKENPAIYGNMETWENYPNEISQTKTYTVWSYSCVDSRQTNKLRKRAYWCLLEEGVRETGGNRWTWSTGIHFRL